MTSPPDAVQGLTLREVTASREFEALANFGRAEMIAWGFTSHLPPTYFEKVQAFGYRFGVAERDGKLRAMVVVAPLEREGAPSWNIWLWIVARDERDVIKTLDALALWACNRLRSEGARWVESHRTVTGPNCGGGPGVFYGRDMLGMEFTVEGKSAATREATRHHQVGKIEQVTANILARRPEWRTSLTSMM